VIELDIYEAKPYINLPLQLNTTDSIIARLMIDTGASHALVLNHGSSEKITIPKINIETKLGRGLTGEINGRLGRIEGFNFGKKKMSKVITSFPVGETNDNQDDNNGTIGGEVLKKYTVIFDFFRSKMYLKPNATFKYPFEYNMSGLEFSVQGENLDQFVISHIREHSATFGIGIEAGDVIVSLNNIPVSKLTLTKIYTSLNLKDGKKINLTVFRDGKYISRSFHLKREI
jgi:C-terminal processing protease CtpA/Prc